MIRLSFFHGTLTFLPIPERSSTQSITLYNRRLKGEKFMDVEGKDVTFHILLKELVKEIKISQKDLGKSVGMTPSHISLFLNGKLDLQSKKFIQLLKVLEIDIEQLLIERLSAISSPSVASTSDSVKLKLKIDRLPEDHRAPLLKIIESLAG